MSQTRSTSNTKPVGYRFDVFVSYSSADAAIATKIAERLRDAGLRVWIDKWHVKPGDDIVAKIEEGLSGSRTQVLLVSEQSLSSDWVTLERNTILFRDPANRDRRLIPLKLDDADWPDTIKRIRYIDWSRPHQKGYRNLVAACQPLFTLKIVDDIPVVRFVSTEHEFTSQELSPDFDLLHAQVEILAPRAIIIDLCQTTIYPSFILSKLLMLHMFIRKCTGLVALVGVTDTVHDSLRITKLDKVCELAICKTTEEALRYIKSHPVSTG